MIQTSPCPRYSLPGLLSDTLSRIETELVTEHLQTCHDCRTQLEHLAAEPELWRETQTFFSTTVSPPASLINDDQRLAHLIPSLQPSRNSDALGLLDGYEIFSIIGFGGMGVVLRAYDPSLDRHVAIKVLHPHLATGGSARRRFAREARAAAAVNHPSVVPIHAVSAESDPPYLVMSYIPGGSLQDRIDRDGPLAISDVLRIGCQVADALAAAHGQGLVHRDVKPGNILLDHGQDRVLLSDFGLAQTLDDASQTVSGMIAGTPQYMSPEQARGETVDHRSDLFSLGGVLYAMTTGRPPFRGESSLAVLSKIGNEPIRPACEIQPDVPLWFSDLIAGLLEKEPRDRPQLANEVAEKFRQCLAHLRSPTVHQLPELFRPTKPQLPATWAARSRNLVKRYPFGFTGGLIAIAMLVLVLWLRSLTPNSIPAGIQVPPVPNVPSDIPPHLRWNDGLEEELRNLEDRIQKF